MRLDKAEYEKTIKLINKHGERVGVLAYRLSQRLELPHEFWFFMYITGRWHDFGKLVVPLHILNKRGALSSDEWKIMRRHPVTAYTLLNSCGFGIEITKTILYHHEDFNGTGYPAGLKGDAIPLGARILRVCDVFDALTEDRFYKQSLTISNALVIMDEDSAYDRYDPKIYKTFREMVLEEEEDEAKKDYTGRLIILPNTGGRIILRPSKRKEAKNLDLDIKKCEVKTKKKQFER